MSRCLDNLRAQHTWAIIKRMQEEGETDAKNKTKKRNREYAAYVKGLPATILMCGLGQAVAILQAKSRGKRDDAHWLLYTDLQEWLCRSDSSAPYSGYSNLMEAITGGSRDSYIFAQEETMRWLEWLKKFATAFLSGIPDATDPENGDREVPGYDDTSV